MNFQIWEEKLAWKEADNLRSFFLNIEYIRKETNQEFHTMHILAQPKVTPVQFSFVLGETIL